MVLNQRSVVKIGVLGGGQLGKMLCIAAANWDLTIHVLDPDPNCSSRNYCTQFVEGSFKDYQTVLDFGRTVDVITIEIEHVNIEALETLAKEGKTVHPNPAALRIINDKGIQKSFYQENKFSTATFALVPTKDALSHLIAQDWKYPFVWKARSGGYDGKGVSIIKSKADFLSLPETPCLIEQLVDFDKEIAVIVARNENKQSSAYSPVEMFFDPEANLLNYQISPARISTKIAKKATQLALKVIEQLDICGVLAVEMFVTPTGEVLINEVAPRPHNSGHHTIEANETSQYEQHLRAILNLPLGSVETRSPSVLVNLLGEKGYQGVAVYEGLEQSLSVTGVHVHIYGKKTTKPFRKMGHATILDKKLEKAIEKADLVQKTLKVISLPTK